MATNTKEVEKEVKSKEAAPTTVVGITLGDLPPSALPTQSREMQDSEQHYAWLLALEREHLEYLQVVTQNFLHTITEQVKPLNPIERLKQLKLIVVAEKIAELTASTAAQMQQSPKIKAMSDLEIQYAKDIVKDPKFMEKLAQGFIDEGVTVVRGDLSILLAGGEDEVGVIPKLEDSIIAAIARFDTRNTEVFQPLVDRVKRFAAVETAIKGIADLHLTDPDEEAHYKILLTSFGEKLKASIKTAVARFDGSNAGFQSIVDRVKRFAAVETAIKGIADLHLTDPDEEAHYGALLTDFCNKLHASITMAKARFDQVNATFQSIENRVKRLSVVETAIKGIADLHLPDPDEEAHYGALLIDFGNKLQASIEEAKKYFAAQSFLTKTGLARLDEVREKIKRISSVGISDEDTKMHYLTLLQEECNRLEQSLDISITQFEKLSKILKKQSSTRKRLQIVQDEIAASVAREKAARTERDETAGKSAPFLHQYAQQKASSLPIAVTTVVPAAVQGAEINMGDLPPAVSGDKKLVGAL